jgi:exonuclease-1
LKKANIEYIVAPYEADSQLAYLYFNGDISAVITEDSDLMTFGVKDVIYKLNADGSCIYMSLDNLGVIPEMKYWTMDRFRQMCILSGCDYLASPPGIGLKTAMKLLKKIDAYALIKSWMNWGTTAKAPKLIPDYLDKFRLADLTFQHQRVYDRATGKLVPLRPFPDSLEVTPELSNSIGPDVDPKIARGIAEGVLDPFTKEPFDNSLPTPPATQTVTKRNENSAISDYEKRKMKMNQPTNNGSIHPFKQMPSRISLPSIRRPLAQANKQGNPIKVVTIPLPKPEAVPKTADQEEPTTRNPITVPLEIKPIGTRKEFKFEESRLIHQRKKVKSDNLVSPYFSSVAGENKSTKTPIQKSIIELFGNARVPKKL